MSSGVPAQKLQPTMIKSQRQKTSPAPPTVIKRRAFSWGLIAAILLSLAIWGALIAAVLRWWGGR